MLLIISVTQKIENIMSDYNYFSIVKPENNLITKRRIVCKKCYFLYQFCWRYLYCQQMYQLNQQLRLFTFQVQKSLNISDIINADTSVTDYRVYVLDRGAIYYITKAFELQAHVNLWLRVMQKDLLY